VGRRLEGDRPPLVLLPLVRVPGVDHLPVLRVPDLIAELIEQYR
jgi:hypothetical protein